jgi:hypothetical protein|uniref:Uncharacterized protein n=1 Tax=uncultured Caudovirales phage TaxID=2100421 RepID=A0A6J5L1U7_9CAUD|nr:hypothetical protein UFOVP88_38 [uncultured Caudovirales phage]
MEYNEEISKKFISRFFDFIESIKEEIPPKVFGSLTISWCVLLLHDTAPSEEHAEDVIKNAIETGKLWHKDGQKNG